MWRPSVYLLAAAALTSDAAAFAPSGSFMGKVRAAPARAVSSMPLKMGLFDGIAKAMNEAMANDPSLGKPQNPGFREGYDGPEEVTVTFLPSGVEVASYQGELLTDVCRRANVEITYGCQKGTCGACEVDVKSASAPGGFGRLRVCESVTTYEPMEIIILDKEEAMYKKKVWETEKTASI